MKPTVLATMLLLPLVATPAMAAPTVQVAGGNTAVELSETLVGALVSLGVSPGAIGPGSLKNGRAKFPIPGGALDLATARGDVFHLGGLSLRAGDTTVTLLNFVIDTTGDPELTGIVSVDGDVVARVPLFDLTLTEAPELERWGKLVVRNVEVTLTAEAADALNDIFGVDAFFEGLEVGVARVKTYVRDGDDGDDDDDFDDDDDDDDRRGRAYGRRR